MNNANVYAMHHFAPDQALRFARAGGNVRAEQMFSPAAIDANPYLRGKTKDQILANWDQRSGGGNSRAATARSATVDARISAAQSAAGGVNPERFMAALKKTRGLLA